MRLYSQRNSRIRILELELISFMNKIAIYTSIIGKYDALRQPSVVDEAFDYILFVRKGLKTADKIGVWQVRELDYDVEDNTITSRYPKMNSHLVLPEYDYTLWMDGNLVICDQAFYDSVKEKVMASVSYSGVKHPDKDCVYVDAVACTHAMRDKFSNIFHAVNFLISVNFPAHYGMYENNIILRQTSDIAVRSFNEMWWSLYLKYPRRDQFTSPYCLRENGLKFDYLLPEGMCAKSSSWIDFIQHNEGKKSFVKYWYDYFACRVRTYALIAYLKMRINFNN